MRITNDEIQGAIELYVNCIYDDGENSDWLDATMEEWEKAVYEELVTWKTVNGHSYHSNENRFVGKDNIMKRVRPLLVKRLKELKKEGYNVKAFDEIS